MTEDNTNIENRQTRLSRRKKKKEYKFTKLFYRLLVVFFILSCIMGGITFAIVKNTPPIDTNNIYKLLSENSFLYDENGELVEQIQNSGLRTNVQYKNIPQNLVNAFIAIEDKTFWTHHGFNFVRIFGAIWESITTREGIHGTSTITQQLARNLYLADIKSERSLTRKIREAYYTVMLEKNLSKEQIMEAYLNTIYLGYSANGIEAASQAYFSKDVKDLSLAECAVIAGITKNPSKYAPVRRLANSDVDPSDANILMHGDAYTVLYDDRFKEREKLVLGNMKNYGFITQEQYDQAVAEDIKSELKPSSAENEGISSYFTDLVKRDVAKGLMKELNLSERDAYNMIYTGGLRIYSTIDVKMQKIVEDEFKKSNNFPGVKNIRKDRNDNIIGSNGRILLYRYEHFFNSNKQFVINPDEYTTDYNGDIILLKGKKLSFYKVKSGEDNDITITFKDLYTYSDSVFCIYKGGGLLVPAEYKSMDSDGNLRIKKAFFDANPDFFKTLSNGTILISEKNYTLSDKVIQPQAAMVIVDYKTGHIKALVGGRNIEGRMLFSRATNPNPPGSSIKPLAVYTPALANGFTAASIIDDAKMVVNGKVWPSNFSHTYSGPVTLRYAVQQSINVVAYKVFTQVGIDTAISYLKNFGITTLIENGKVNDKNGAALSLGGMTQGVTPLEMTAAYGTLANGGTYIAPTSYVKVLNKNGDVILQTTPYKKRVVGQDVAFIMTDILKSAVTSGTGSGAKISGGNSTIPVAGKTGTTSNNYDAWFMGYTPYYVAGVWIGNDIDLELTKGSAASAHLWGKIMAKVHSGLPAKGFTKPSNVISVAIDSMSGKLASEMSYLSGTATNEYFIDGTQPTQYDEGTATLRIDKNTGYLATPLCPPGDVITQTFTKGTAPRYYCPYHNPSTETYPVDPNFSGVPLDLNNMTSGGAANTNDGASTGTDSGDGTTETNNENPVTNP